jgi:hypothetical protein
MKTVWVFNGARSSFPSGVFETREEADTWIRKWRLTGTLTRCGFSHKMSLEGKVAKLGIDHQGERFRDEQPGADPGVFGQQRGIAYS